MVFELQKELDTILLGGLANEGALLLGRVGEAWPRGLAARLGREAWPRGLARGRGRWGCDVLPAWGPLRAHARVWRENLWEGGVKDFAFAPSHTHQSRTFFTAFFHLTL